MSDTVMGLDPSLTATGVALPTGHTRLVKPGSCCKKGMPRLRRIRDAVMAFIKEHDVNLVMIEGYSYGSRYSHAHALGELGGILRLAIFEHPGVRYIDVPPSSLKKFATGKGNANKELVLVEAVKRLDFKGHDNNMADALWLRAMGLQMIGEPLVDLPKTHLEALDKIGPDTE